MQIKSKIKSLTKNILNRCTSDKIQRNSRTLIALVIFLHIIATVKFVFSSSIFSAEPLLNVDYSHHYHQVRLAIQGFGEGRLWNYDPTFSAGYPEGTLFDVDMKLIEILSFFATNMGLPLPLAYNSLIFIYFILPPLLLLGFCKNLSIEKTKSLLIVFFGTLIWHSNQGIILFNQSGMAAFIVAIYWSIFSISSFHKQITRQRLIDFVELTLVLAVGFAIHILSPILMAPPLLYIYLKKFRSTSLQCHLSIFFSIFLALAANSWWLLNIYQFWDLRIETTFFRSWKPSSLFIFSIALGSYGWWQYRNKSSTLAETAIFSIISYSAISLLIARLPFAEGLELGRFYIPAMTISSIGIAFIAERYIVFFSDKPEIEKFFLVTAGIFIVFFGIQFFLPRTLSGSGFSKNTQDFQAVIDLVDNNTNTSGRVAFMDKSPGNITGAKLSYFVDRQYIGGPFSQMNIRHSYASFSRQRFFDQPISKISVESLEKHLNLYNIHWVVTTTQEGERTFEKFPNLLDKIHKITPPTEKKEKENSSPFSKYRKGPEPEPITLFKVKNPANWFIKGSGEIRARANAIEVTNASPGETIIKYHWVPGLQTNPPLEISKHREPGLNLDFIRIKNGENREFTISPANRIKDLIKHKN